MKYDRRFIVFEAALLMLVLLLTGVGNCLRADTSGNCSGQTITLPFNDVAGNGFFCQIAAAFFSGLTNGTSATTYSPDATVTRGQMAAFITRTLDQSLRRNNRRAVTKKWYLSPGEAGIALTSVGDQPQTVKFDGTDLWVANFGSGTVQRIRPGDGKVLQTWTGATGAYSLVCARGRIFVTGDLGDNPGRLYFIDPTQAAGTVSTLLNDLPAEPHGIAFDGARVWTANQSGSVSIITLNPPQVNNVSINLGELEGIVFDGSNMWVTDQSAAPKLIKLSSNGGVLTSLTMGGVPQHPVFDGINIWVPNSGADSVTVVRAKDSSGNSLSTPFILATLNTPGLNDPTAAAFDGERIMITNRSVSFVTLYKAADLSFIKNIFIGLDATPFGNPFGVCSDGLNFWVSLSETDKLARL